MTGAWQSPISLEGCSEAKRHRDGRLRRPMPPQATRTKTGDLICVWRRRPLSWRLPSSHTTPTRHSVRGTGTRTLHCILKRLSARGLSVRSIDFINYLRSLNECSSKVLCCYMKYAESLVEMTYRPSLGGRADAAGSNCKVPMSSRATSMSTRIVR